MSEKNGFSRLGVHNLVYKDTFCEFAQEIRDELLTFSNWVEMRQDNYQAKSVINPGAQNGITTGHITDKCREWLPNCLKFRELIESRLQALCETMGIQFSESLQIEMNGMAYGEGSWLSGHTDFGASANSNDRLVAWMLYLTHPLDEEWSAEKGGAVRLWTRDRKEIHLRPKFNRFAMFRVHKHSFHEIEKITWPTGWERCRLTLSGWIRGAYEKPQKKMRVYLKSPDYMNRKAKMEASLKGSLALYELMLQQKRYCGADTGSTMEKLAECRQNYEAHLSAPSGTSFIHHAPGPAGCITVLNEEQKICYFGSMDNFQESAAPLGERLGGEVKARELRSGRIGTNIST
jgi:hypothetical protein